MTTRGFRKRKTFEQVFYAVLDNNGNVRIPDRRAAIIRETIVIDENKIFTDGQRPFKCLHQTLGIPIKYGPSNFKAAIR